MRFLARYASRRRETVEHPLERSFLMKMLTKVAAEMALHVLPYKLTRAMNILGVKPLRA